MANFRHNIKGNRFVIIAPARVTRPHDSVAHPQNGCPFCPENDGLNKEIFRIDAIASLQHDVILEPRRGGAIGSSNWLIRVIENKYPLTQFHEVIIHSPDHEKDIDELPLKQVELILQTYRQRYNYNKKSGSVLIFNNHDIHAGASLSHPHSQVVVVPPEISVENIVREPVNNIVLESKNFIAYCPDYSEWPYEIWLTPNDNTTFGQITDEQIKDLAGVLQKILKAIVAKWHVGAIHESPLPDIPYNFYIYHGENWYLRIIPRFVHRAGFELGTGILVNIVNPKTAAEEYKESINPMTNIQYLNFQSTNIQ